MRGGAGSQPRYSGAGGLPQRFSFATAGACYQAGLEALWRKRRELVGRLKWMLETQARPYCASQALATRQPLFAEEPARPVPVPVVVVVPVPLAMATTTCASHPPATHLPASLLNRTQLACAERSLIPRENTPHLVSEIGKAVSVAADPPADASPATVDARPTQTPPTTPFTSSPHRLAGAP